MSQTCTHLDLVPLQPTPSGNGCVECLAAGDHWLHLRICQSCGHIGCCDSSPGRHATAHNAESGHPMIRSFEPGEDWYYCYADDLIFEAPDAPPAPSHT